MTQEGNIIELKVDGMDCANCAAGIDRYLTGKGLKEVFVNFATGEVQFSLANTILQQEDVEKGINELGYRVINEDSVAPWWTIERKLWFAAFFTAPLFFQHIFMVLGIPYPAILDNPYMQLVLCLPVFLIGLFHFGRSAWAAVSHGTTNMDVLIFIGSTAAFVYSLIGTYLGEPNYIFYETAATIITLVLVGNWLEHRSVQQTTTAIDELSQLQVEKANKVLHSGTIINLAVEEIKVGDILQVNEGDTIPLDGKIISGSGFVDESMLTGESLAIAKNKGQGVVGASIVKDGNFRMQVTATGKETLLSKIIEIVKTAQQDKPAIQKLADQISAWFVPIVLSISILTLVLSYFVFGVPFGNALMNSIAVLVISCPCAMGLATPTAVTVGIGRMAKEGVLVKGGQTLETFGQIKQFVFDKTGTLTTGDFAVKDIDYKGNNPSEIHDIIYAMETYSSHPIAQSLVKAMQAKGAKSILFQSVEEQKGKGMVAEDKEGNTYELGASKDEAYNVSLLKNKKVVSLLKNKKVLANIRITDELRPDATTTIDYLHNKQVNTYLLSGDKEEKVEQVANELAIKEFYGEQRPAEKLRILNNRLSSLTKAVGISQATLTTIKQNLFWAFAYNIVAIPMAAVGWLSPMWAALFMAFSDVVVNTYNLVKSIFNKNYT